VICQFSAALISLGKQVIFPDGYSISAATLISISAFAGIAAGYAVGL